MERRTIVTWRSPSTHQVIWIVLWIFRSKLYDFLPRHGCRLHQNLFVFIGLYFGTNTMDAPGFASPIRTYRQNLSKMRDSNDPNGSEVTNLCSLGVVDLDLSLCPDVFGLKAFDENMPILQECCRAPAHANLDYSSRILTLERTVFTM